MLDCRKVGAGSHAEATRFEATVKPGPRTLTNTFEVSTRHRPDRIDFRGSNEMADFDGYYELEPVEGGTRVSMVSRLDVHGPMRLLMPIMAVMSRKNARRQFDQLRGLLEDQ